MKRHLEYLKEVEASRVDDSAQKVMCFLYVAIACLHFVSVGLIMPISAYQCARECVCVCARARA